MEINWAKYEKRSHKKQAKYAYPKKIEIKLNIYSNSQLKLLCWLKNKICFANLTKKFCHQLEIKLETRLPSYSTFIVNNKNINFKVNFYIFLILWCGLFLIISSNLHFYLIIILKLNEFYVLFIYTGSRLIYTI